MACLKKYLLLFALAFTGSLYPQPAGNKLLQKGWAELVKDNDTQAFRYFWQAYEQAKKENNTADKAESLLYLGICSYGSSREKGLQYATQALNEFKKLEGKNNNLSRVGRSRCLQLISTIYSRQGKNKEAMKMSREVVAVLKNENDVTGTLGLAYASLGKQYEIQSRKDSASHYYTQALQEFKRSKNYAYMPGAYISLGNIKLNDKEDKNSLAMFEKALTIADSTQNKQAQVSSLVALGRWYIAGPNNRQEAEHHFEKANSIAAGLSDKMFEIKTLEALISLREGQKNYIEASRLQERLIGIKDTFYSLEREQMVKSLEVQFEVAEKDRELEIVSKEKEVSRIMNFLLGGLILLLAGGAAAGYYFFKSINRRDKQLLKTKEELVEALEKQKLLKEQQFQNDLEHKEGQLSAITLQMLQKNELLEEIKEVMENNEPLSAKQLQKMINRYFTQDSSWSDFDKYFESINKNFYTRLKQNYPDISGNDLKICALIKLNLSIKEMASILNISPDSVKTARYRLRKKLQLATEENLTEFILSI